MTELKTYICDICKEEAKIKDLVKVDLEQNYRTVEYHAHPTCLDKAGLQWSDLKEVVADDKSWLTGEPTTPLEPPFKIQSAMLSEAVVGTCPQCNHSFPLPTDIDPEDVVCPNCGYTYNEPQEPHVGSPVT